MFGQHIVLVYPNVAVTTAEAYAQVRPHERDASLEEQLTTLPMSDWRGRIDNDFEQSVFPQHPVLAEIKKQLYKQGATYASMSGSGSTVVRAIRAADDSARLVERLYGMARPPGRRVAVWRATW